MRIFAQCDSEGNILSTAKVEIMAEELDHPFGDLEGETVVVEIEPTSELEARVCHEFEELYLVDLQSQELKRKTTDRSKTNSKQPVTKIKSATRNYTKIKSATRSYDAYLSFGLDLI